MVIVECESGGGKSRLLEEFSRCAEREGIWVLHGQGVNEVGQHPFQVLEDVLRGLNKAAKENQAFADRSPLGWRFARRDSGVASPGCGSVRVGSPRIRLGPEHSARHEASTRSRR